jgi:diguanylate cyclase (GGDEF)-like protein
MRRTSAPTRRRVVPTTLVAVALVVTALAGVWIVSAAKEQHSAASRAARAARFQRVIDLVRYEHDLVEANRRQPTSGRSYQIDQASSQLMGILRHADTSWDHDGLGGLSAKYGADILLADSPSRYRKTQASLSAVARAAATGLQHERSAALVGPPQRKVLLTLEVLAALAAAVEGPLLLFWVFRRHRHRVERRHQERVDHLAAQARTDALTRLGNRRAFDDDLGAAIAARAESAQVFTLVAIDLDGLKRINDSKGHPAGDAHIRTVAECIRSVVAGEGTVYRTGGDEFMIILPGRRNWHGLNLAAKIDQETRARTGARAVSIGLTESVEMEGRHLLMNQADIALYEAKRTRLSAVAYHPGLRPATDEAEENIPSHEQRALAAALARAVDAKDAGTRSHSETVAQLCVAIGERLRIEPEELERLRLAGLLHDVGKIGVADAILQKPDVLAPDEHSAMTEHVEIGHAILLAAELPIEAHWVLHHHERFDGGGYPSGLRGASIPVQSRIIAVADAFEAMTGTRPYRDAIPVEDAVRELQTHAGTQFDARCVDALVEVVNDAATEDELVGIAGSGHVAAPLMPRAQQIAAPAPARS